MGEHQNESVDGSIDYTATPLEKRVPDELAGLRLDQALARMFPEHSRSRLTAWLRDGHILVDSGAGLPKHKIWGGERIAFLDRQPAPGSAESRPQPEAIALTIVHEDAAVLVIDKPAGLVVHPGSGNWQGTMLNALLHHSPPLAEVPRAGIVHRLDKDTSGLLVVAKTLTAQTDLVRQLQARTVKREYLALVHGSVRADGRIDAPVGRDPRNRLRMSVVESGKEARTRYQVLERFARATLVECALDTGRTHQIRVHMQALGNPLVGDPVYRAGRPQVNPAATDVISRFPRQALHAVRLAFIHPETHKRQQFESPLPADFRELLTALRQPA